MPQLDVFMFQTVIFYAIIVFFLLSYNIYQILINIFKILKTRILLKKNLNQIESHEPEIFASWKKSNNILLLEREIDLNIKK